MIQNKEKVVVSGIGVISSLGFNRNDFFNNLCLGRCASGEIQGIDTTGYVKKNACMIQDVLNVPLEWYGYSRAIQMALLATKEAIQDSGLSNSALNKAGIIMGTMNGGSPELEEWYCKYSENTVSDTFKDRVNQASLYSIVEAISSEYQINGVKNTVMTACSSGTMSIGLAYRMIQRGNAELIICGGVDAFRPLTHLGLSSFRITAPSIVQPFDINRKGILVGEGAGILVLESESHARQRGANVYCTVKGFGAACDADDLAHPSLNGYGMGLAMSRALEDGGIDINQIDYINAHGTGTKKNDTAELAAISNVFRERDQLNPLYVTSIKGNIGHAIGAAGAIESIAAIQILKNNKIPPNINCTDLERTAGFIRIPQELIYHTSTMVLSNSFGFGGNNASIIYEEETNEESSY